MMEYNPEILGFSEKTGPLKITLKDAKESFGLMPSSFGFVTDKEGRKRKKVLNLVTGKVIKEIFKDRSNNLKGVVSRFYNDWHRDMDLEFGVDVSPFVNLNDSGKVFKMFLENMAVLSEISKCELHDFILTKGFIRKDVLNSIPRVELPVKCKEILNRKLKQSRNVKKKEELREVVNLICAQECLRKIEMLAGESVRKLTLNHIHPYSDEIAEKCIHLSRYIPLKGSENLTGIRGEGIEFQYASRNFSYLLLGKDTGDCTVGKPNFQADTSVENIFWTVFSWILDRNYQILKVYYDGEFIMKFHLLPLYVSDAELPENVRLAYPRGKNDYMMLAVDALETVRAVRDDLPEFRKEHLVNKRDMIFHTALEKIKEIAGNMGICHIYAEKFSNTGWIREHYDRFPEIFLHIDHMIKIDHLEDVYGLAHALCKSRNTKPPGEIFMEIQMKNRFLVPKLSNKAPGVKPFALIQGSADHGISMSRVMGI